MKELCCKFLAAVFIVLIIASLVEMRRSITRLNQLHLGPKISHVDTTIHVFDRVMVPGNILGVVENMTNNSYHVVFRNEVGQIIHGDYFREQIRKVVIPSH